MRGIWLALAIVLMVALVEWTGCAGPRLTLPAPDWHIADPNVLSCCR